MEAKRRAQIEFCATSGVRFEEPRLVLVQDSAGAVPTRAQRLQERDEVVVAQALELAHGEPARLRVGLRGDLVDELVVELRDVGQLRPRPLQRGAELLEEVTHAFLAAGDAVRQERPHLRPAQTRPEPDRVVDLRHRGDVVVDEPERLAPERLEQPVGDEAVDLGAHV